MKDREEVVVVVVTSEDGQLRGDWHSARHLPPHGPLLPEGGPQPDHEVLLPGKPQHHKYFGIGLLNFLLRGLFRLGSGSYLAKQNCGFGKNEAAGTITLAVML